MTPSTDDYRLDYHLFGTHVRFGDGVSGCLREELAAMGLSRPAILTQPRIAASAGYHAIVASLSGLEIRQAAAVPAHSSVSLVETMAADIGAFGADCLVAVGGGSVADSAKALALLLAEGGRLADHMTIFSPPAAVHIPRRTRTQLPIIAIPTTASGAEVTSSFGVRDDAGDKLMFWNRQVSSATILIDPVLNQEVPLPIMRYTAMNGIAHCLEGLYSKGRSIVSDGIAVQALALFQRALSGREDEARERRLVLLAGHLSGMVLSMARSCLHHAICHVVGARYRLGHGLVNTVILPHAIRFNEAAAAALLRPALDQVNRGGRRQYESLAQWLTDIQDKLGLPGRLSALGVPENELEDIARHVMTERGLALNPRPVTDAAQVLTILRDAF
jgi:alcohol dehydrogenase class IV